VARVDEARRQKRSVRMEGDQRAMNTGSSAQ
jgi:hypothetical protein